MQDLRTSCMQMKRKRDIKMRRSVSDGDMRVRVSHQQSDRRVKRSVKRVQGKVVRWDGDGSGKSNEHMYM